MQDINKFIGIKHKFNCDTFENCDCLGLLKLFYREHGWKETFDDGKSISDDWKKDIPRLIKYLHKNFHRTTVVETLTYGDIVLIKFDGDLHMGIYTKYNQLLCMQIPCWENKSISTLYRLQWWQPFFYCAYKRRGD